MIIVILQAGLGNQMFQYALGRSLAVKRNTKLMLDTSWYQKAEETSGVSRRAYELGPLDIIENFWRPTLLNRLRLKAFGHGVYTDDPDPYLFHPAALELPDYTRLFGFFQNERYFKEIRDIIVKEFTLKAAPTGRNQELLGEISTNPNTVSLHVRRGDYVTSQTASAHHGAKGLDYYKQAVAIIKKTVPKPSFYVFSDDPAWCKDNLKLGGPTTYIDHNTYGGDDMNLMRACRHNVIANSSFSWWGAWLNANPDKIVVAPKQWLNDAAMDTSDIVPPEWIKI